MPKADETVSDQLDISVLESLTQAKALYQTPAKDSTKVDSKTSADIVREAEERNRFEKSHFVQKEVQKAFKEIMKHEFRLVSMFRPQDLIAGNFDEFMKEVQEKERTT